MIILIQILVGLSVAYVSFRVGYVLQDRKKYVSEKKRTQPYIDILKILNSTALKDSYFIRRINNSIFFNIDGIFILLYTKDDYSYLTFYKDMDFDNMLYTPYLDDIYDFTEKEENILINKLLEFYNTEISNTVKIGNLIVDLKYGEQYTKDLIKTLNTIAEDNKLNIKVAGKDVVGDNIVVDELLSEQEKLDLILDQISIKGINSLSTEQQTFLKNQK